MKPSKIETRNWMLLLAGCAGIALITWFAFMKARHFPFIYYDDELYLIKNPRMNAPFSWNVFKWCFATTFTGDWQPFVWLIYFLLRSIHGLDPSVYHAFNIVLHILNAVLVFFIFQKMTNHKWSSLFLALFFSIHPLRAESVVWVSEMKDTLSGVFWWLTIWAYQKACLENKPNFRNLALLFFLFGIFSKPVVVSLPLILLLLDYWPLRRFEHAGLMALIKEKTPFFILSFCSCVLAVIANNTTSAIRSLEHSPMSLRLANGFISYFLYITKIIFPKNLSLFYIFPHPAAQEPGMVGLAICGFALISAAACFYRKRFPHFFIGWFWYVIVLIPMIGILRVSDQAMADRYTYLPTIGLLIAFVWSIGGIAAQIRPFSAICGVFILTHFFSLTQKQVSYWISPLKLNEHALQSTENNYVALSNLGLFHFYQGELKKSLEYYSRSLKIKITGPAVNGMANVLIAQKRYKEAEELLEKSLKYPAADLNAGVHHNLGILYLANHETKKTEAEFKKVLEKKPNHLSTLSALGYMYLEDNRLEEAEKQIRKQLSINPLSAIGNCQLGILLEKQGRVEEAIPVYEKAATSPGRSKEALSRLIVLWSLQGELDEIKRVSLKIREKHPEARQPYLVLSQLALSKGDFSKAELYLEQLLKNHPDFQIAKQMLDRVKLGEKGSELPVSESHLGILTNSNDLQIHSIDDVRTLFDHAINATSKQG